MMDHPHQKAWAMKHPALARVFIVVLGVMCFILLMSGINGLGTTQEDNEERLRYEEKFAGRISNYIELDEKLSNSISYDEAYAELEKMLEQHDDDASQHKTDLAMYSAEKGGNTMGADMIWEAMPEVKGARQQLDAGKQQLAEQEAQFQQLKAAYQANEPAINALIASANAGAGGGAGESARLGALMNQLGALMAQEPVAPEAPAEVTQPAVVTEPVPVAEPVKPGDESDTSAMEQYNSELALYEQYLADKAAYDQYLLDKAAYQQYLTDKAAYDTAYAEYQTSHGEWEAQCIAVKAGAGFAGSLGVIQSQSAALTALAEQAAPILSAFGSGSSGGGGGMDAGALGQLAGLAAVDPTAMSNEDFLASAGMLQGALDGINSGFAAMAAGLGSIGPGIEAGGQQLEAAKAELAAGEEALKKAEHELQTQLENIWYNLGELEKERAELEETRDRLDEEAAALSKQILETDELRELENDHVSAKLLLTSVKEVNDMFEETDDLVGSAEKYLADYKADTEMLYTGGMAVNILAILSALAGFAAFPAAYEKIKKRFWLIGPVVICILLSGASELLNMYIGLGQMYPALFTVIIAAIHLLIVLPQEKKPVVVTEA